MKKKHHVPPDWLIYVGCDIGSGGNDGGHPSAISYVAVNPNMREGRVFRFWRGDGIVTTAGDVVNKNIEIKKEMNIKPMRQFYDWASKDFFNIASRTGESFEKAEKDHEIGFGVLNTLFKNDMLYIYEDEESLKLASELVTLKHNTPKNKAVDDGIDSLRYAVSKIPWDWSVISEKYKDVKLVEELTEDERKLKARRDRFNEPEYDAEAEMMDDFEELNDAYG
jgi:hypothetical protein